MLTNRHNTFCQNILEPSGFVTFVYDLTFITQVCICAGIFSLHEIVVFLMV